MAQILFFGGSSVQGVGDTEGGWVDRFKRELHGKMYGPEKNGQQHHIFNLGILGNASSQVLERIPYELPERQWDGQNFVVVIGVGTNDSKAEEAPTNYVSNVQEFMVTLQNIIDFVRSYTSHIVVVGMTPIDDTRTRPTANGTFYSQGRVQEFNAALMDVAQSNHLAFVEVYNSMLALDWRAMLYDDGLHLNSLGHEWLYHRIRQPLLTAIDAADRTGSQQ